MNDRGYDDTIPLAYLNNENPYAYCTEYHRNSINMQDRKTRLNALQRIQPTKISFKMPLRHVEREREYLLEDAVNNERKALIKKGLSILQIDYHDNPELLFEKNIHNSEILEIALKIKKLNLFNQQKTLRFKVSAALSNKNSDYDIKVNPKEPLEIDNLKDALIYCKLEDLYSENLK